MIVIVPCAIHQGAGLCAKLGIQMFSFWYLSAVDRSHLPAYQKKLFFHTYL
ncbi:hypothetical protein CLOSTMETH_00591 [[Clostridium] methylpentosum DSM 5476]|uniref:Uncharacterized protein n=1 Tax=[Clostridium] methylpentosum DSM 5476 TaxID=537013 RepID=C0E9U0_9FIRM|nr:hypothetical protein CLOSTMETH_00591 [[Clostridium] methylpentosum DSM 5476]